jgi:hypothetical protein
METMVIRHRQSRHSFDCGRRWSVGLLRACGLLCVVTLGCSGRPGRVETPDWDPGGFAAQALEEWDGNGDQSLDAAELTGAPGLAAGAALIDQNGDKVLSLDELTNRFELYRQSKVGLCPRQLRFTYRGRPLDNAAVTLVPETFLDGVIEPAEGTTDSLGNVTPNAGVQGLPGMRSGYYRVKVTAPGTQLPVKFSDGATVGVEVSNLREDPATQSVIEVALVD